MIITEKQIVDLRKQTAFWLKRWYNDPVAYSIEHLKIIPTYQQAEILRALQKYKFVAVRSGHGIGKSKIAAIAINWYLDTHTEPGELTRVPITGAGGSQLESTLWAEVNAVNTRKWATIAKQYTISSERMYLNENPKGCFAVLRTPRIDNPDALQGFHKCFFVIDEGSGVPDEVFEVARGAMGDEGSYGLMMGNPTRLEGYFYNVFHNARSVWHTLHFSSLSSLAEQEYSYQYVNPMGEIVTINHRGRQTTKWINDMREEFGENSNAFKIRVLGEFALGEGDQVIEQTWLKDVFINRDRDENKHHPKIMGVDVARTGNDFSAVCIRQNDQILFIAEWHGADTVLTRRKVELIQSEWKCAAIGIDTIGVGGGLYDELRALGYPVYSVDVNQAAPEPNLAKCKTMRDHLWWKAREFFRTHTVRFNGNEHSDVWRKLQKELIAPRYTVKTGKLIVESKDDMKKRGAKSPNLADALNNTFLRDSNWAKQLITLPEYRKKKKKNFRNFKTV